MSCCGKAIGGVVGLTKAALGIDRTSDRRLMVRVAACKVCEHRRARWFCGLCGCFLAAKVRIKTEHCPADPPRW